MTEHSHGGKRKGAGRKPGTLNKRTREIAEKAAATGDLPADVMIANMRYAMRRANEAEIEYEMEKDSASPSKDDLLTLGNRVLALRQIAQEAAKDAAPYFHPRLAAVAYSGGAGLTIEQALDQLDGHDDDDDTDGTSEGDLSQA